MTSIRHSYSEPIILGEPYAENDEILLDEFVSIDTTKQVDNDKHALILGRKGSGKSALRLHFENKDDKAIRSASLTPEVDELDTVFEYITEYRENPYVVEPLIRLWEMSILIALIKKNHESGGNGNKSDVLSGLPKVFVSELEKIEGLISPASCIRLMKKLEARRVSIENLRHKLLQKIEKFSSEDTLKYYALIDSVDEALHNEADTSNRKDLYSTYFEALVSLFYKAINKERKLFNGRVVLKLFVPLDIYDWSSNRHDDKLGHYQHHIRWNRTQLLEFMIRRLYHNLDPRNQHRVDQIDDQEKKADAIWEAFYPRRLNLDARSSNWTERKLSVDARAVFLDNTLLRPRDLQGLVDQIETVRIRNRESFPTQGTIFEALEENSSALERSVRREYGNVFPEIDDILSRLSAGSPILTKNQLDTILEETCQHDPKRSSRALKYLYESCIIGATKNEYRNSNLFNTHKEVNFYFDFGNFNSIKNMPTFVIHKAFWSALMIIR